MTRWRRAAETRTQEDSVFTPAPLGTGGPETGSSYTLPDGSTVTRKNGCIPDELVAEARHYQATIPVCWACGQAPPCRTCQSNGNHTAVKQHSIKHLARHLPANHSVVEQIPIAALILDPCAILYHTLHTTHHKWIRHRIVWCCVDLQLSNAPGTISMANTGQPNSGL